MTSPDTEQYFSTCPSCDGMVDVSPFEPYSKVLCPHCGETIRVRRKFDHFVITRQIGEGGMSYVFEAVDETLERRVALKILNRHYSKDAERMAQFEREARLTASVTHPNVVKLYSVGRDQGNFYIAMELVSGGSLESRISDAGKIAESDVLQVGRCVAEGLRSAHREGLIHRDVKPANILYTEENTPKIVDFGLALIHGRDVDESGEIWATPFYVAPEKLTDDKEDFRSDIYSLGATLYHALVGKPPYKANTNSIEDLKKIKSRPVRLEDSGLTFAPRTCELINRMLALKPEDRFESYDTLVESFRDAASLVSYSIINERTQRQKLFYIGAGALGAVVMAVALLRPTAPPRPKTGEEVVQTDLSELGKTLEAGTQGTVADAFLDARSTLLSGNYKKARTQFDRVIGRKDVKQPTLNWARFNAALCAIVDGRKKEVEKYFADIKRDADAGAEIGGHAQREFFSKIGDRMSQNLGLDYARKDKEFDYARDSEQVLGYLVHGLAHWHFGRRNPAQAVDWLETFSGSQPPKGLEWIGSYKELIAPYLADVKVAKSLPEFRPVALRKGVPAEQKKSMEEARLAQEEAKKALAQLKTDGVYRTGLTLYIKQMETDMANSKREAQLAEAERMKELRKRELAQFNDIVSDLPALVKGYDFTHAVSFLKDIHFEVPELQSAISNKQYMWSKAHEFMEQLMKDVNTRGYVGAIARRQSPPMQGKLVKLDYVNATIALERGEVGVTTISLAPDLFVAAAQKFCESITDSTEFYRRQEMIVVFAKMNGLDQLANAVAQQLMEENRSFRQRWVRVEQTGS